MLFVLSPYLKERPHRSMDSPDSNFGWNRGSSIFVEQKSGDTSLPRQRTGAPRAHKLKESDPVVQWIERETSKF